MRATLSTDRSHPNRPRHAELYKVMKQRLLQILAAFGLAHRSWEWVPYPVYRLGPDITAPVLDGKTGRPVTGRRVYLWKFGPPRPPQIRASRAKLQVDPNQQPMPFPEEDPRG